MAGQGVAGYESLLMTSVLYICVRRMLSLLYINRRVPSMNIAARRYLVSCSSLMLVYAALVALISWGVDLQQLPYALRVIAAASPAIPLLASLYVFDRY